MQQKKKRVSVKPNTQIGIDRKKVDVRIQYFVYQKTKEKEGDKERRDTFVLYKVISKCLQQIVFVFSQGRRFPQKMKRTVLLFLIFVVFEQVSQVLCYQLFCYYTNWSQYRHGTGKFLPRDIDPKLCTHILYAFGTLTGTDVTTTEWNDDVLLKDLAKLKRYNPNLKILLSIGGWNAGSLRFSNMAASPASRLAFARSAQNFVEKYHLDGFDIDWEYPVKRGGKQVDRQNFVHLLQTMKAYFANRYLLTIAVGMGKSIIDTSYNVAEISRIVDYVLFMTYDFHGSWEKVTGHVAPLYAKPGERFGREYLNVDYAVRYWLSKGAPPSKLIMGIPLYGRSFTLSDDSYNGMMAPAPRPGNPGPITQSAGIMSYNEICLESHTWTKHWDEDQKVTYLTKGNQWLGIEDQQSLKMKCEYLINRQLGGAMVWALDQDDFNNACKGGTYPLLRIISYYMKVSTNPIPTKRPVTRHPPSRWTPRPTAIIPNPPTWHPSIGSCPAVGSQFVSDPHDRHVFHFCVNGRDYRYICPPTLVWDPRIKRCNYDWR